MIIKCHFIKLFGSSSIATDFLLTTLDYSERRVEISNYNANLSFFSAVSFLKCIMFYWLGALCIKIVDS